MSEFTTGDLRELKRLLQRKHIQDVAFNAVYKPTKKVTGLRGILLELLEDKIPRTLDQIQSALHTYQFSDAELLTGLQSLYIDGTLKRQELAGGSQYSYQFYRIPNIITRQRKPTESLVNTMKPHVISTTDSLDTAIFKAMADREERTLDNIASIVAEFGFAKPLVKDRIMTLMRRKIFFDRIERKEVVYIRLKKHVKSLDDNDLTQDPLAVSEETKEITQPSPNTPISETSPQLLPEDDSQEKIVNLEPIEHGDHLRVAIWKIMRDQEWYSVADLVLLLGDYGFKENRVASYIGYLFNQLQILERETRMNSNAGGQGSKRTIYTYRLKEGVEKPVLEKDLVKGAVVLTPALPKIKDLFDNNVIDTPSVKTESTVVQNQASEEEIPFFQFEFRIKGILFTAKEAHQLYQELDSMGLFKHPGHSPVESLIQHTTMIKGQLFTDEELRKLHMLLNDFS